MKVRRQISDDKVTMYSPMVSVNQTIMMAAPVLPHSKISANAEAMDIQDSTELSSPHIHSLVSGGNNFRLVKLLGHHHLQHSNPATWSQGRLDRDDGPS